MSKGPVCSGFLMGMKSCYYSFIPGERKAILTRLCSDSFYVSEFCVYYYFASVIPQVHQVHGLLASSVCIYLYVVNLQRPYLLVCLILWLCLFNYRALIRWHKKSICLERCASKFWTARFLARHISIVRAIPQTMWFSKCCDASFFVSHG